MLNGVSNDAVYVRFLKELVEAQSASYIMGIGQSRHKVTSKMAYSTRS